MTGLANSVGQQAHIAELAKFFPPASGAGLDSQSADSQSADEPTGEQNGQFHSKELAAAAPTVSVVIPYLDEEHNLPVVLGGLPASLYEVVLVDGQSRDRSMEVAREHRPDAVFIGQHAAGKGAALIAGLLVATGDIVVLMDADCSMMPDDIDRFVEKLIVGADVVKGSRNLPGGGSADLTPVRAAGNMTLTRIANVFFGVAWSDLCFGYIAMWRDVIAMMQLGQLIGGPPRPLYRPEGGTRSRPKAYGHGFEIETLMLCRAARAGLVVEEVPSFEGRRRYGSSNLNAFRDGLRAAHSLLRERMAPAGTHQVKALHRARMARRLGAPGFDGLPAGEILNRPAGPPVGAEPLVWFSAG